MMISFLQRLAHRQSLQMLPLQRLKRVQVILTLKTCYFKRRPSHLPSWLLVCTRSHSANDFEHLLGEGFSHFDRLGAYTRPVDLVPCLFELVPGSRFIHIDSDPVGWYSWHDSSSTFKSAAHKFSYSPFIILGPRKHPMCFVISQGIYQS